MVRFRSSQDPHEDPAVIFSGFERQNIDYDTKKYVDYVTNMRYKICILAQRGRFLETILQDGARSGVPRLRREPYRGRFGPRPPGIHGLARAVAAASRVPLAEGQRGSAAGKRHGGAPKGVPVAPGRSAPYKRGRRASHARQKSKSAPVGAPSTPHRGDGICCCRNGRRRQSPRGARRRT